MSIPRLITGGTRQDSELSLVLRGYIVLLINAGCDPGAHLIDASGDGGYLLCHFYFS